MATIIYGKDFQIDYTEQLTQCVEELQHICGHLETMQLDLCEHLHECSNQMSNCMEKIMARLKAIENGIRTLPK